MNLTEYANELQTFSNYPGGVPIVADVVEDGITVYFPGQDSDISLFFYAPDQKWSFTHLAAFECADPVHLVAFHLAHLFLNYFVPSLKKKEERAHKKDLEKNIIDEYSETDGASIKESAKRLCQEVSTVAAVVFVRNNAPDSPSLAKAKEIVDGWRKDNWE